MKLLEDQHAEVRTAAIETLDELLPSEVGPLYAGLQGSFLDLRVRAAELLAVRHDEQLIDAMRALLADKSLFKELPSAFFLKSVYEVIAGFDVVQKRDE